ncbi:MAG: twin-arginine translocase TatA/TatE family subunit [Actinomycetota bacterium]
MRPGFNELLLLLLIVMLLFGATRLPKLARSLREAKDEFNKGSEEDTASEPATKPSDES